MNASTSELATLAGGCFWCTEAVFNSLKGVNSVVPGYSGGSVPNPTYTEVCAGSTGHAEAIQITFDPNVITYRTILEVFFATHNPTTLNRQGADTGTQYRSIIFTHSPEQSLETREIIQKLTAQHVFDSPIVTEVVQFKNFYPAEDYHQNYYTNNPNQPYCQVVINPKVAKLRAKFAHLLSK